MAAERALDSLLHHAPWDQCSSESDLKITIGLEIPVEVSVEMLSRITSQ